MHYVIGDIHGCHDELMGLLEKIEKQDEKARFLFVGDFIDRGPKVWDSLEWAKSHITKSGKGKYRSVMGNHEALMLEWYPEFCSWYEKRRGILPAPLPMFDFLERAIEMDKDDPASLLPYVDFFSGLPYHIRVRVPGKRGYVIYDIVHAWMPPKGIRPDDKEHYYLWEREKAAYGNEEDDHIIIHGHTPTIYEAKFVPEAVPGMILYRKNAINIDGGCVFASCHEAYPCMLCALCLETLEEIYPWTIRERMEMQMPDASPDLRKAMTEKAEKTHEVYLQNPFRLEIKRRLKEK